MDKKGISSIVSVIFVIAIGVLITVSVFSVSDIFFNKVYEYSENTAEKDVACFQEVAIDLQKSCYLDESHVNLYIASNGIRKVDGFLVRLHSKDSQVNLDKEVSGLNQFMINNVKATWDNKAMDVNYVEVFPQINFNNKLVVCSNAKKAFGNLNSLNTITKCSS